MRCWSKIRSACGLYVSPLGMSRGALSLRQIGGADQAGVIAKLAG